MAVYTGGCTAGVVGDWAGEWSEGWIYGWLAGWLGEPTVCEWWTANLDGESTDDWIN